MTDHTIIAEWPLNWRGRARVSIEQFNGTWLVSVRKWFEADDGSLRPGKHGIALGLKHLPPLAKGLAMALTAARVLIPTETPDGALGEK
jgi:Transcriptional Coactivator p15 (PC4)